MNEVDVEAVLAACERELAAGGRVDLRRLSFWRAVEAVKRRPEWVVRYAQRIALIDRGAFERAMPLRFSVGVGLFLLGLGTLAGVVLLGAAFALNADLAGIAILLGTGAVLGSTHGLAHVVVGSALGVRFTHWFMDVPRRPQPGFKIDYASYLRAPARSRAWMHASGALVSKAVPFAAVPIALLAGTPAWTTAILIALGVAQIVTDLVFSVRASDWKRFRREMRAARNSR